MCSLVIDHNLFLYGETAVNAVQAFNNNDEKSYCEYATLIIVTALQLAYSHCSNIHITDSTVSKPSDTGTLAQPTPMNKFARLHHKV